MSAIDRLLEIMAQLRNPEGGCPWDLEQDFASIAPYTIEEAYEVDDAIRQGDFTALRDELGDLLLQVVFHAQMAREEQRFAFDDVVEAVCDKLVRRHPHVFGDADIATAEAQTDAWEQQKQQERAARGETSVADGVPLGLPALLRTRKLLSRAKRVGFAWPKPEDALAKVEEELAEVRAELASGRRSAVEEEVGDVLMAAAGLASTLDVEPETALRGALAKFEGRLRKVESGLRAEDRGFTDAGLEELLQRWEQAKRG